MSIEIKETSPKTGGEMSLHETPKKQSKSKPILDYTAIGVELYNYYAVKKQKPNWDAIATKLGSASGDSVQVNWRKFCKKYEMTPMASPGKARNGGRKKTTDDVLKPIPMKVTKNAAKGTARSHKKGKKDTTAVEMFDEDHDTSIKMESGSGAEDLSEGLMELPGQDLNEM